MTERPEPESLEDLCREVDAFVRSLEHPVVAEDDAEQFDLRAANWRLAVEFGKLIFEAWNSGRTFIRRVDGLAYRDGARLGVFVRRPHARETSTLEFHESPGTSALLDRAQGRTESSRRLAAVLREQYRGWRLELIGHRSDREFSFSTWYTRGLLRQGQRGWAFLGLDENEPPAASDSMLAFGLIWLDWLRNHSGRSVIYGLKLFMPHEAVALNAWRVKALNPRGAKIELFGWTPDTAPQLVDIGAHREAEAKLVPRRQGEMLLERHRDGLRELLGKTFDRVNMVPDSSGAALSIRVEGLEVARVEGDLSPRIFFGLEGKVRHLDPLRPWELTKFIEAVLERRTAGNSNHQDEFYRLHGERWLESILIRDITKLDPELSPGFVYSQVPAFSGEERGVIDILSVSRSGRLAVIELKLAEEINLPFQALDYWMRVADLAEQGRFAEYGYFPGAQLEPSPPRLYLVAPAFRFHSTLERLLRYFNPRIEVFRVGINQGWREGVQVLFRRSLTIRP